MVGIIPFSSGRYLKSMGSLTSWSEGLRSCIFTVTGSEMSLRNGGVRNTMATWRWTSAWEKEPLASQLSRTNLTSMSSRPGETGDACQAGKLRTCSRKKGEQSEELRSHEAGSCSSQLQIQTTLRCVLKGFSPPAGKWTWNVSIWEKGREKT